MNKLKKHIQNEQENLEQVEMTSKDVVDMVLQLLGLSHRADTIVGNAMIRGVSGGEKKRVTVCFFVFVFCLFGVVCLFVVCLLFV